MIIVKQVIQKDKILFISLNLCSQPWASWRGIKVGGLGVGILTASNVFLYILNYIQ